MLPLSGSYFKRTRDECSLILCVTQVRGGFLAQPSCRSSPRAQLSPLTAVWWISDIIFLGVVVLCTQLATGKETLSCPVLVFVAPASPLCHKGSCVHAWIIHPSPWSKVPAAVEHLGCMQSSCPPAMMSCIAGLSHSCHVRAGFISLHHRAKAARSQIPVLGSLSPRLSVCSALCSCDNPYLLWKGNPVL